MPVIDEQQRNVAAADTDDSRRQSVHERIGFGALMREQQSRHRPIAGVHWLRERARPGTKLTADNVGER